MSRREFLRAAGLGSAALVAPSLSYAEGAATRRPNVVLILADDLGWGDLGCYGHEKIQTPHLDRLAREGVRLTSFYADAPVCSPTRASLLTGRMPQRNGLTNVIETTDQTTHLRADETLISEMLQRAAYATGIVGKWHVGEPWPARPNRRGFDFFYGGLLGGMDFYRHDFVNAQHDLWLNDTPIRRDGHYITDVLGEQAAGFLRRSKDEPFFLYLSFQAVHISMGSESRGDIQAPPRWLKQYQNRALSERQVKYYAAVSAMDEAIGRVLDEIDKAGVADDTVVIFTSDNGREPRWPGSSGPFFGTKHTLWEGGIRVPMIVRWPKRLPAGEVCSACAMTHDLAPTILSMTGVDKSRSLVMDGIDLTPLLKGRRPKQPRTLYWSYIRDTLAISREKAVRRGQWKWLNGALYDLESDSKESRDVSAEHPAIAAELEAAWNAWVRQFPDEVKRWGDRKPKPHGRHRWR